jgi:hypothetical protein
MLSAMGDDSPAREHVLSADTIAVIEKNWFLTGRAYDLVAVDGTALGSVSEQASTGTWFFGSAAPSVFTLTDASGEVVAVMHRPGSLSRSQFVVAGANGVQAGLIEPENALPAPQFRLTAVDGAVLQLRGGAHGGTDWELIDPKDAAVVGRVHQEVANRPALLGGKQRFAVRLSPVLAGDARLLAVMATACLDYLRDVKPRR